MTETLADRQARQFRNLAMDVETNPFYGDIKAGVSAYCAKRISDIRKAQDSSLAGKVDRVIESDTFGHNS